MTMAMYNWIKPIKVLHFPKTLIGNLQTQRFVKKALSFSSFGLALAKCEEVAETALSKTENLTHEQCIKQACLLSVNSATTLLTTTSLALLDMCKNYKESLNRILFLLEAIQSNEGENPELWDSIVEARAHVNKYKASLNELNLYMETVEKVVNSTTEAAFLAGAEYLCTALCERFYSAQKEINNQIDDLKKLEEDYLKLQSEIVVNRNKDTKAKVTSSSDSVEIKKAIKSFFQS